MDFYGNMEFLFQAHDLENRNHWLEMPLLLQYFIGKIMAQSNLLFYRVLSNGQNETFKLYWFESSHIECTKSDTLIKKKNWRNESEKNEQLHSIAR